MHMHAPPAHVTQIHALGQQPASALGFGALACRDGWKRFSCTPILSFNRRWLPLEHAVSSRTSPDFLRFASMTRLRDKWGGGVTM
jgi:hypothetical protein